MQDTKLKQTNNEWKIIDYSPYRNCDYPLPGKSSVCGDTSGDEGWQLTRLFNTTTKDKKWICPQHLSNYRLEDKDKEITKLKEKIDSLERQNNDRATQPISELNKQNLEEREEKLWEQAFYRFICRKCQGIISEVKSKLISRFKELEEATEKHKCSTKIQETKSLTKLQGILTSNLRTRTSTAVPYMAFFRPKRDCKEHTIEECERTKCQECEIPVVFRIEDIKAFDAWIRPTWIKPTLKKGDKVILEGELSPSEKSNRPSFTCYSYEIIKDHGNN